MSLSNDEYKFYAAELGAEIPELDLHGNYPDVAVEKLEIFISDLVFNKENIGRVIYGGGTGKLREIVLNVVKKSQLVKEWKEGSGSCLVLIN